MQCQFPANLGDWSGRAPFSDPGAAARCLHVSKPSSAERLAQALSHGFTPSSASTILLVFHLGRAPVGCLGLAGGVVVGVMRKRLIQLLPTGRASGHLWCFC